MAEEHHRSGESSSHARSRSNRTPGEATNRSPAEAEVEDRSTPDATGQGRNDQATQQAAEDRIRRAEEMVDRIGMRVGELTAAFGHQLLRFGARVREEAEDIWAEAQNLRRGPRP
jgi:hypothetical protein